MTRTIPICITAWLLAGANTVLSCPEWIVRGDGFEPCDASILASYHAGVAHLLPRSNTLDYALSVLVAHGNRPPILILASPDSAAAEALRQGVAAAVQASGEPSMSRYLADWLAAIKWVELARADYSWPQDAFITWADPASGRIHFTERPPSEVDQTSHAEFTRRIAEVLSACGRFRYVSNEELLRSFPGIDRHAHAAWELYAGGNLEGVGADLCLTSNGLHEGFLRDVLSTTAIEIDISFLHVGHVDELFAVIRAPTDGGCRFDVLWASPGRAMELVAARAAADPDSPLVSDALFDPSTSDTFVLQEFFTHLESNAAKRPMRNRTGDLLRIYEEEELFRLNVELVEATQQRNLGTLTAALRARYPGCAVLSHALPVLFANVNYWLPPAESASNFALYSNQVNSVFFAADGRMQGILVDGQINGFNDYAVPLLQDLGIRLSEGLFDASAFNRDLGNLHCATQVIHACNAAAIDPTEHP